MTVAGDGQPCSSGPGLFVSVPDPFLQSQIAKARHGLGLLVSKANQDTPDSDESTPGLKYRQPASSLCTNPLSLASKRGVDGACRAYPDREERRMPWRCRQSGRQRALVQTSVRLIRDKRY